MVGALALVRSTISPRTMSKNLLRFALASALAALLAGCGGSDAPPPADPLARYQNQTVQWNDCSAYLEKDPEGYARKLGPRLQCAQVQVPQDYQNPDAAAVMVSIMRVRAAQAPDKKPHLFGVVAQIQFEASDPKPQPLLCHGCCLRTA